MQVGNDLLKFSLFNAPSSSNTARHFRDFGLALHHLKLSSCFINEMRPVASTSKDLFTDIP